MSNYDALVVGYDHINLLSIIRGLGREKRPFFAVILCDDNIPKVSIRSRYLKHFIICRQSELLENLYKIGNNLKNKVPIICGDDYSTFIIDQNLNHLNQYFYCSSIRGCEGEICQMMDKYEQYLFAQRFHIPMAKTCVISLCARMRESYEYPLILKPRFSAFGEKSDICKVNNEEELYQALGNLYDKGYQDILAQKYIEIDYECTFYGVVLNPGRYTCNGVKKIFRWPRVGGSTVHTVTISPPEFIKQVLRHLGEVGYVGMYDIELYVKDGQYILNEINFRHTGLGYVELSNSMNSCCDLIDYFNGDKLNLQGSSRSINSVNTRELICMLKAGEVSLPEFIKIELISRSHSLIALDDPMPCLNVIAAKCKNNSLFGKEGLSMNKLLCYIRHPSKIIQYVILYACAKGVFNFLSDELFIKLRYRTRLGKKLNLEHPKTFNEKLEWLKLYDRNPIYTQMADKFLVREHVKNVIGEEHLIPLLGVWEDADAIDFEKLPDQFVLKCNHNSGRGMCICTDKSSLNLKTVRKGLKWGLHENHYLTGGREWPYKNIRRKIIAEKYMVDESGYELKDYKFFTFSGKVYCVEVDYDRFTDHHRNFYSREWAYMPFTILYPTDSNHKIDKPECLEEMIIIAEKLAASIGNPAFLRVDLYCIGRRIYFGELTFYHDSGEGQFFPEIYDEKLGDLISLKH